MWFSWMQKLLQFLGLSVCGILGCNPNGISTTPLFTATVACVPTEVHVEDIDEVEFKTSPGSPFLLLLLDPIIVNLACFMVWDRCYLRGRYNWRVNVEVHRSSITGAVATLKQRMLFVMKMKPFFWRPFLWRWSVCNIYRWMWSSLCFSQSDFQLLQYANLSCFRSIVISKRLCLFSRMAHLSLRGWL